MSERSDQPRKRIAFLLQTASATANEDLHSSIILETGALQRYRTYRRGETRLKRSVPGITPGPSDDTLTAIAGWKNRRSVTTSGADPETWRNFIASRYPRVTAHPRLSLPDSL